MLSLGQTLCLLVFVFVFNRCLCLPVFFCLPAVCVYGPLNAVLFSQASFPDPDGQFPDPVVDFPDQDDHFFPNGVVTKTFAPKFRSEPSDREVHSSYGDYFRDRFCVYVSGPKLNVFLFNLNPNFV